MDKTHGNRKDERRMSSTGILASSSQKDITRKENKKFSDDRPGAIVNPTSLSSSSSHTQDSTNATSYNVPQKQSFLSRFASAEARSSIAAATAAFDQVSNPKTSTPKPNIVPPDIQCDTVNTNFKSLTTQKGPTPPISIKSKSSDDRDNPTKSPSNMTTKKPITIDKRSADSIIPYHQQQTKAMRPAQALRQDIEEDDVNDQVLPVWPSRIEVGSLEPAVIQHQVYSLKDYSQVAGPTKPASTVASSTGGSSATNRLLKSMSQDRKFKAKRMSECIYTSQSNASVSHLNSIDHAKALKQQRNSTIMDQMSSASFSMGPATSVNSLLTPAGKNNVLIGESRIDKMRKLFVSPLSLRSSGGGGAKLSSQGPIPDSNPRLSLQSGANMLNKPHHHLMHAMYRTRAHHSRRSPMRQKQGTTKGFRVYGCPLQMANNIYPITCFGRPDIYKQQSVPYILARLCNYIEETSSNLTHEGIFRVSGNARLMEKLRTLFDRLGDAPLESESVDVATSASMLKMYLRELPEPLIPTRMNYYFITLAKKYSSLLAKDNLSDFKAFDSAMNPTTTSYSGGGESMSILSGSGNQSALDQQRAAYRRDLTKLVRKLPIENYNLLKYLACFLYRISLKQQFNKMCAEALGIVFGPNVFRIRSESYKGLKEQELSNQIMASIISNYKSIFDCELTDPLGNLVASTEDLRTTSLEDGKKFTRDSMQLNKNENGLQNLPGHQHPKASGSVSGPSEQSQASTSASTCQHKHTNCHDHVCFHNDKSSKIYRRVHEGEEEDDDDDLGDVDEDDDHADHEDEDEEINSGDESDVDDEADDEEDCDDESYSPSSGSSYCSSLESDTVESSCGEDDDDESATARRYNIEPDSDEMATDTSSECETDTNYTPSSSHSDSDDDPNDSPYYKSSSYDSITSFIQRQESKTRPDTEACQSKLGQAQAQSDNPCRVCKRRESAQIEANQRKLLEVNLQQSNDEVNPVISTITHTVISDNTQQLNPTSSSGIAPEVIENANPDAAKAPVDCDNRQMISGVKSHHKSSRRRKQNGSPKSSVDQLKRNLVSTNRTNSDQTLDHSALQSSRSRDDARYNRRQQSKQGKHSLLRRRSSSASSLLRIKNRNGQLIAKKTFASRDSSTHVIRPTHHHKMKLSHSERRKPPESKRPRRTHSSKRGDQHSSSYRVSGSKRHGSDRHGNLRSQHGNFQRLTSLDTKELVWDYASSSYLEIPDRDTMYLKSYNSDETLLRSSENYIDPGTVARNSARRFSDHEHLMIRKNTIQSCGLFGEICEAIESDRSIEDDQDKEARSRYELQYHKEQLDGASRLAPTDASTVSLLEDRMTSFRHSNLSIEDDCHEYTTNPLLSQLKSVRTLMKLLKSLLKPHEERSNQFVKMSLCVVPNQTHSRDWNLCHLDHLSAVSIIELLIDDHTQDQQSSQHTEHEVELATIINTKLFQLRERYNRSQIIYEHYTKHHQAGLPPSRSNHSPSNEQETYKSTITQERQSSNEKSSTLIVGHHTELTSSSESLDRMAKVTLDELEVKSALSSGVLEKSGSLVCKFGSLCPVEFVFKIEKQLALKQLISNRLIKLDDMNVNQLQSEKLELQKNLLRFEHWFGRPSTRLELLLTGHLYERYRVVKSIKQQKKISDQIGLA